MLQLSITCIKLYTVLFGLLRKGTSSIWMYQRNFKLKYKESARGQVTLQCKEKKWVYAHVSSDSPWLKVLNPEISGPQKATLPFEVDSKLWDQGATGEGKLTFQCNGGQKLTLKVIVEVAGAPAAIQRSKPPPPPTPKPTVAPATVPLAPAAQIAPPPSVEPSSKGGKYFPALVTAIAVCLLLRVLLVPFVDFGGRSTVAQAAADKMGFKQSDDSPIKTRGGWLLLPWVKILGGGDAKFPATVLQLDNNADVSASEFRHYFTSYFIRWFVLRTWWLGAVIGAIIVIRRGGFLDLPWGVVAGATAGLALSATFAAFFLVVEMIPHTFWHLIPGDHSGAGFLLLWCALAVASWFMVGVALGIVVPWIAPLRRVLIDPFQSLVAGIFGIIGMKALADYWSPT